MHLVLAILYWQSISGSNWTDFSMMTISYNMKVKKKIVSSDFSINIDGKFGQNELWRQIFLGCNGVTLKEAVILIAVMQMRAEEIH